MKLKKINAILGLGTIAALLIHMAYNLFCYFTMYYNPVLTTVFTAPIIIFVCLHAVTGMSVLFLHSGGTRADLYPDLNRETVLQRLSAALIFPLLLIHMNTHGILESASSNRLAFFAVLLVEVLFFATVMTHVSISLSRAFVTLGWLESIEKKQKIDRAVYIIMGILFVISVTVIVRGQILLFS